jgi:hypothetical protein
MGNPTGARRRRRAVMAAAGVAAAAGLCAIAPAGSVFGASGPGGPGRNGRPGVSVGASIDGADGRGPRVREGGRVRNGPGGDLTPEEAKAARDAARARAKAIRQALGG